MSFLGDLGRGLLGAIPVVGPALSGVMSGGAKGGADQRLKEGQLGLQNQQLLQQGARDQFGAGLQGAQFQQSEQDRARKAAMLMQLLNNTQDQTITPGNPAIAARMGTVTGGARPSNLTTNREALMALLSQPQISAPQYQAPSQYKLPQAGAGENIMGGIGLGSSVLTALGPLLASLGQSKPQNIPDVYQGGYGG